MLRMAIAIILFSGGGLLCAQENAASQSVKAGGEVEVEQLVPIDRSVLADDGSNIETNLNSLLETVKRAQNEITGQQTTSAPSASPASVAPPRTRPLSAPANNSDQGKRVSDLKKRIELLQRLRRRDAIEKRSSATQPVPITPTLIPAAIPPVPSPDRHPQQPTLPAIEENLKQNESVDDGEPIQPEIAQAKQILKSPVDHLSLAESLYRTRNYAASLKTLKSIDGKLLSLSDRTWLELLTALCHRRLGNLEKAEAQLREISNAKIADRSVPLARWWLKQTEISATTTPTLAAISSDLDSLIERSKNHVE
jgi:hypothetical protein